MERALESTWEVEPVDAVLHMGGRTKRRRWTKNSPHHYLDLLLPSEKPVIDHFTPGASFSAHSHTRAPVHAHTMLSLIHWHHYQRRIFLSQILRSKTKRIAKEIYMNRYILSKRKLHIHVYCSSTNRAHHSVLPPPQSSEIFCPRWNSSLIPPWIMTLQPQKRLHTQIRGIKAK